MARKARRRFTVEEKLRILEEARQPQTTVAEVLRRRGVDAATYYRWERLAKAGMREALAERPAVLAQFQTAVDTNDDLKL